MRGCAVVFCGVGLHCSVPRKLWTLQKGLEKHILDDDDDAYSTEVFVSVVVGDSETTPSDR